MKKLLATLFLCLLWCNYVEASNLNPEKILNNVDDISIEENELNYKIFYEKKFNQIRIEGIDLNQEYLCHR